MKISDAPLSRYLIKNLQPLTEADPVLLANYVAALLKNNKPKKELQKLCNEQLYDFLGDGTRGFVTKLFHALEDGSLLRSGEDPDLVMQNDGSLGAGNTDISEAKGSPHQERMLGTVVRRQGDEVQDESSDDEDDDRNHKHRRRVSRSQSFERDRDMDEVGRVGNRKHGRSDIPQQPMRENEHHTFEPRRTSGSADREGFSKRVSKEQSANTHSRFNIEGHRGMTGVGLKAGSHFSNNPPGSGSRFVVPHVPNRGGLSRGRIPASGTWLPHEQRLVPLFSDGPDFQSPGVVQGPPNVGFYPNRVISGRGGTPQPPWSGFTPMSVISNGSLDNQHPMNSGLQGARGANINSGVGNVMRMPVSRPRCPDFEERGYCLRGDLCPMEHGANRIVVEDFQSLSKFNLPATLPGQGGRTMPIGPPPGSGPSAISILMPTIDSAGRGSRETALSIAERTGLLNGTNNEIEPDSYDPDQPLFNKEPSDPVQGLRKLPSFQNERSRQDWPRALSETQELEEFDLVDHAKSSRGMKTNLGLNAMEAPPSVWDRIGPVGNKLVAGTSKVPPIRQQLQEDNEQAYARSGLLDVQGDRQMDTFDEAASQAQNAILGRGSGELIAATQSNLQSLSQSNERILHSSHRPVGRGSGGVGGERAQRTLYVRCIPTTSNKIDLLLAHFQKFGEVLDIRIPPHSDRAFVQFAQHEDAEKALTSPDAVMGNRFIRLSWANRDNIIDSGELSTRTVRHSMNFVNGPKSIPPELVPSSKDVARPVGTNTSDPSVVETTGKVVSGNVSTSAASSSKKQEELEQMKEEIRKKQEALAKKREDFRLRLEKLARQGKGVQTEVTEGSQPSKRAKLGEPISGSGSLAERQGSSGAPSSQGAPLSTSVGLTADQQISPTTGQKAIVEEGVKSSAPMVTSQPSTSLSLHRGIKSPHPRGNGSGPGLSYASPLVWGPARYKLDYRTMVFRIIPPIPAVISDVSMLREHFAKFGELSSVEVENADFGEDGKLKEASNVQVTFSSRRAAERAFSQGRSCLGQPLKFAWVNSLNGNLNPATGRQTDLSTGNVGQAAGELATLEQPRSGQISEPDSLGLRAEADQEMSDQDVRKAVSKTKDFVEVHEEISEAVSSPNLTNILEDATTDLGSEALPAP